jgi:hypothetical protein
MTGAETVGTRLGCLSSQIEWETGKKKEQS